MSFFSKLLKKSPESKSPAIRPGKEETKCSTKKKSKKKEEKRQLAINKVNVNNIYNKNENYMPVNFQPANKHTACPSLQQKNVDKFRKLHDEDASIDIDVLRKISWQGIPQEVRAETWKVLLKYAPLHKDIRDSTITRKRDDYKGFVNSYYVNAKENNMTENEQKIMKIIINDVFRTQPNYKIFHHKLMQDIMIKILWVWQVRHPATGYVQGMNDLITPFLIAFLTEHINNINMDTLDVPENFETNLNEEISDKVEADTFWCLSKILDGILDNFTFKAGTEKAMDKIKGIIKKIDSELFKHLEQVDPSQYIFKVFSLRWLFSLLIREFSQRVAIRLFDTYISDEQGFSVLHLYVCASILLKWSKKLKKMNLDNIMLFLQDLPTKQWSEQDLDVIIAEAFVFKTLYEESGHFATV
jgi:hypothetical protein